MNFKIELPIERQHSGKGNPGAVVIYDIPLTNRQQKLLDSLPDYDSRIIVPKKSASMRDLATLTAKTNCEFAMFTRKNERFIIRGNEVRVNIDIEQAENLAKQGYRFSGHTHPGTYPHSLIASKGDISILEQFPQSQSVIYNSLGQISIFGKD
jgi:hypothetical protein